MACSHVYTDSDWDSDSDSEGFPCGYSCTIYKFHIAHIGTWNPIRVRVRIRVRQCDSAMSPKKWPTNLVILLSRLE